MASPSHYSLDNQSAVLDLFLPDAASIGSLFHADSYGFDQFNSYLDSAINNEDPGSNKVGRNHHSQYHNNSRNLSAQTAAAAQGPELSADTLASTVHSSNNNNNKHALLQSLPPRVLSQTTVSSSHGKKKHGIFRKTIADPKLPSASPVPEIPKKKLKKFSQRLKILSKKSPANPHPDKGFGSNDIQVDMAVASGSENAPLPYKNQINHVDMGSIVPPLTSSSNNNNNNSPMRGADLYAIESASQISSSVTNEDEEYFKLNIANDTSNYAAMNISGTDLPSSSNTQNILVSPKDESIDSFANYTQNIDDSTISVNQFLGTNCNSTMHINKPQPASKAQQEPHKLGQNPDRALPEASKAMSLLALPKFQHAAASNSSLHTATDSLNSAHFTVSEPRSNLSPLSPSTIGLQRSPVAASPTESAHSSFSFRPSPTLPIPSRNPSRQHVPLQKTAPRSSIVTSSTVNIDDINPNSVLMQEAVMDDAAAHSPEVEYMESLANVGGHQETTLNIDEDENAYEKIKEVLEKIKEIDSKSLQLPQQDSLPVSDSRLGNMKKVALPKISPMIDNLYAKNSLARQSKSLSFEHKIGAEKERYASSGKAAVSKKFKTTSINTKLDLFITNIASQDDLNKIIAGSGEELVELDTPVLNNENKKSSFQVVGADNKPIRANNQTDECPDSPRQASKSIDSEGLLTEDVGDMANPFAKLEHVPTSGSVCTVFEAPERHFHIKEQSTDKQADLFINKGVENNFEPVHRIKNVSATSSPMSLPGEAGGDQPSDKAESIVLADETKDYFGNLSISDSDFFNDIVNEATNRINSLGITLDAPEDKSKTSIVSAGTSYSSESNSTNSPQSSIMSPSSSASIKTPITVKNSPVIKSVVNPFDNNKNMAGTQHKDVAANPSIAPLDNSIDISLPLDQDLQLRIQEIVDADIDIDFDNQSSEAAVEHADFKSAADSGTSSFQERKQIIREKRLHKLQEQEKLKRQYHENASRNIKSSSVNPNPAHFHYVGRRPSQSTSRHTSSHHSKHANHKSMAKHKSSATTKPNRKSGHYRHGFNMDNAPPLPHVRGSLNDDTFELPRKYQLDSQIDEETADLVLLNKNFFVTNGKRTNDIYNTVKTDKEKRSTHRPFKEDQGGMSAYEKYINRQKGSSKKDAGNKRESVITVASTIVRNEVYGNISRNNDVSGKSIIDIYNKYQQRDPKLFKSTMVTAKDICNVHLDESLFRQSYISARSSYINGSTSSRVASTILSSESGLSASINEEDKEEEVSTNTNSNSNSTIVDNQSLNSAETKHRTLTNQSSGSLYTENELLRQSTRELVERTNKYYTVSTINNLTKTSSNDSSIVSSPHLSKKFSSDMLSARKIPTAKSANNLLSLPSKSQFSPVSKSQVSLDSKTLSSLASKSLSLKPPLLKSQTLKSVSSSAPRVTYAVNEYSTQPSPNLAAGNKNYQSGPKPDIASPTLFRYTSPHSPKVVPRMSHNNRNTRTNSATLSAITSPFPTAGAPLTGAPPLPVGISAPSPSFPLSPLSANSQTNSFTSSPYLHRKTSTSPHYSPDANISNMIGIHPTHEAYDILFENESIDTALMEDDNDEEEEYSVNRIRRKKENADQKNTIMRVVSNDDLPTTDIIDVFNKFHGHHSVTANR